MIYSLSSHAPLVERGLVAVAEHRRYPNVGERGRGFEPPN
jgi:hypothetical protein